MSYSKYNSSSSLVVMMIVLCFLALCFHGSNAQLSTTFYDKTCPSVSTVVTNVLEQAHSTNTNIYASILRLHFHDCFVQGCDGSVLLDNSPTIKSEKDAGPNRNSLRGFEVIEDMKTAVEKICPGVVSCADILTIAAELSVVLAGGPGWPLFLGRRDGRTASPSGANNLPIQVDSIDTLRSKFAVWNFDDSDIVALSGAHTFGRARCVTFANRLHSFNGTGKPDPTINSTYLNTLQKSCPQYGNGNTINNFDPTTPDFFDSNYYTNLQLHQGLLQSDQELFSTASGGAASTASIVDNFAKDPAAFFNNFASAMVKMGNINPLTGSAGEIRVKCNLVN